MKLRKAIAATLLLSTAAIGTAQDDAPGNAAGATLHADTPGPTYDRRIFPRFTEHLGNGTVD